MIKIVLAVAVGMSLTACSSAESPVDDLVAGTSAPGEPTPAEGDASGAAGGGAMASCVAAITFEDQLYLGVLVPELPVGDVAGTAQLPPCNDTGTTDEQPSKPFPVLSIPGVDPSVAVATQAEAADGYWVWFPGGKTFSGKVPAAVQKVIDAAS